MIGSRVIPNNSVAAYREIECFHCHTKYWAPKHDNQPRCPHCGTRDCIHPTIRVRLDGTLL